MRSTRITGLHIFAVLIWAGCAGSAPIATPTPAQPLTSAVAEEAASPTPEVAATAVEPTPTADPEPTAAAKPQPTSVGEATPAAAAEGSNPSMQTKPVDAPAPTVSQPLPLHPFQPAAGRARVAALDPGHGGPEVGAAGAGLAEKDVNLKIALKLKTMLEQDGFRVVITRDKDSRAYTPPEDSTPAGYSVTRQDLQTRMDLANRAQADVFLSIHNNGSGDPGQSGTEVWYDGKRPFGAYNKALAEDLLSSLVGAIRSTGYQVKDKGIKEDSQFRTYRGYQFPIFVLGPPRSGTANTGATQMPAALGETLFLSNPVEAEQLRRDEVLSAIARGYREGLRRYFQRIEGGSLVMPPGGFPVEVPNRYDLFPAPQPGR